MTQKDIGNWLTQKREQKEISQDELSIQIGKTQSCIAKIEKGTRKIDLLEFIDISTFLNLSDLEILELFHMRKENYKSYWDMK